MWLRLALALAASTVLFAGPKPAVSSRSAAGCCCAAPTLAATPLGRVSLSGSPVNVILNGDTA